MSAAVCSIFTSAVEGIVKYPCLRKDPEARLSKSVQSFEHLGLRPWSLTYFDFFALNKIE